MTPKTSLGVSIHRWHVIRAKVWLSDIKPLKLAYYQVILGNKEDQSKLWKDLGLCTSAAAFHVRTLWRSDIQTHATDCTMFLHILHQMLVVCEQRDGWERNPQLLLFSLLSPHILQCPKGPLLPPFPLIGATAYYNHAALRWFYPLTCLSSSPDK